MPAGVETIEIRAVYRSRTSQLDRDIKRLDALESRWTNRVITVPVRLQVRGEDEVRRAIRSLATTDPRAAQQQSAAAAESASHQSSAAQAARLHRRQLEQQLRIVREIRDIQSRPLARSSQREAVGEATRLLRVYQAQNAALVQQGRLADSIDFAQANRSATQLQKRLSAAAAQNRAIGSGSGSAGGNREIFGGSNFAGNIASVARFSAAVAAVQAPLQAIRAGIGDALEISREFATLSAVFQGAESDAGRLKEQLLSLGVAEARSAQEAIGAGTAFARLGLTRQQTLKATEVALRAANVAEISAAEAAQQLIAILQGFDLPLSDLTGALDLINSASNRTAATVEDLLDSIQRSGAAADQAGLSLGRLAGITASVVQATGQSGAIVGTALRTVLVNLQDANRQDKLKDLFDFDVRGTNGQLKDASQLLGELSQKFKTLSTEQQNALAVTIAGNRQYGRFLSILREYDGALQISADALRDTGNAAKENEKILNSGSAAIERASSAWASLWVALGDSPLARAAAEDVNFLASSLDRLAGFQSRLNERSRGGDRDVQTDSRRQRRQDDDEVFRRIAELRAAGEDVDFGTVFSLRDEVKEARELGAAAEDIGRQFQIAADKSESFALSAQILTRLSENRVGGGIFSTDDALKAIDALNALRDVEDQAKLVDEAITAISAAQNDPSKVKEADRKLTEARDALLQASQSTAAENSAAGQKRVELLQEEIALLRERQVLLSADGLTGADEARLRVDEKIAEKAEELRAAENAVAQQNARANGRALAVTPASNQETNRTKELTAAMQRQAEVIADLFRAQIGLDQLSGADRYRAETQALKNQERALRASADASRDQGAAAKAVQAADELGQTIRIRIDSEPLIILKDQIEQAAEARRQLEEAIRSTAAISLDNERTASDFGRDETERITNRSSVDESSIKRVVDSLIQGKAAASEIKAELRTIPTASSILRNGAQIGNFKSLIGESIDQGQVSQEANRAGERPKQLAEELRRIELDRAASLATAETALQRLATERLAVAQREAAIRRDISQSYIEESRALEDRLRKQGRSLQLSSREDQLRAAAIAAFQRDNGEIGVGDLQFFSQPTKQNISNFDPNFARREIGEDFSLDRTRLGEEAERAQAAFEEITRGINEAATNLAAAIQEDTAGGSAGGSQLPVEIASLTNNFNLGDVVAEVNFNEGLEALGETVTETLRSEVTSQISEFADSFRSEVRDFLVRPQELGDSNNWFGDY